MKITKTTQILALIVSLGSMSVVTLTTGCAGDRYHESTGENIDDRGITMRVKNSLSDDTDYKYEGVNVTTFKGTVQLSGFVDTHAQKSRAAGLAKGIEGVKDVENNITVK